MLRRHLRCLQFILMPFSPRALLLFLIGFWRCWVGVAFVGFFIGFDLPSQLRTNSAVLLSEGALPALLLWISRYPSGAAAVAALTSRSGGQPLGASQGERRWGLLAPWSV